MNNSTTPLSFVEQVYEVTKRIPRGKVATYKQIASLAGNPRAFRAVGSAMKKNPYMPTVPCHRVVGSDGSMHGYSGANGVAGKKHMLIAEGVEFIADKVDLSLSQWHNTDTPTMK